MSASFEALDHLIANGWEIDMGSMMVGSEPHWLATCSAGGEVERGGPFPNLTQCVMWISRYCSKEQCNVDKGRD